MKQIARWQIDMFQAYDTADFARLGLPPKAISPCGPFSFRRKEKKPVTKKTLEFLGKVNRAVWMGGKPRTWRCTEILPTTEDAGRTFDVTYSFVFNWGTWDFRTLQFQGKK